MQAAVSKIQEEIPDAEVRVKDNVLHIVVSDATKIPGFVSGEKALGETTNVTSVNGGSYRTFHVTAFATFAPYSQVYMNKAVVDSLRLFMTEPSVCQYIIDSVASGLEVHLIVELVKKDFKKAITIDMIKIIAEFGYWFQSNLEYWSLTSAQSQSSEGKASVVRGRNIDGYEQVFYYPWNGNQCPTYSAYKATWYEGVYDVGQA